jgi:hypothetical protein
MWVVVENIHGVLRDVWVRIITTAKKAPHASEANQSRRSYGLTLERDLNDQTALANAVASVIVRHCASEPKRGQEFRNDRPGGSSYPRHVTPRAALLNGAGVRRYAFCP